MKKGLDKAKELFWYSDSEPNEVLIAMCHVVCLPLALIVEFENPSVVLIVGGMSAGLFQLWSVIWNGTLRFRLIAVQIAAVVAIMTVLNLYLAGMLVGSRTGWFIIMVFAMWNCVRVFNEKLERT
jgi:hypothetical protein